MMNDSQANAGSQTEIVAGTESKLAAALPMIIPFAFCVLLEFVTLGIWGVVCLLLIGIAVGADALYSARYRMPRRALLDREGMTLLPLETGRFSGRPLHFRWDEVLEVRRASRWKGCALQVRLDRPRKFWTFSPQRQDLISVPRGVCANPQFAEAIRAHVPAERIHGELACDERLSLSARYRWVLVLVMLACAAMTAGCSFAIIRGENFLAALLAAVIALMIGAMAMAFCASHAPRAFGLIAGIFNTFAFLSLTGPFMPFFFPSGLALIAAGLGAAAGTLAGAAIMVIKGRKAGGWGYAGATFVLAAAGFWCAWTSFHQISEIRVDAGSLDIRSPWTPKGDAFWITEGDSFASPDEPASVCWYSRDLKLERRAVLPGHAHTLAVGEDAALLCVKGQPDDQLWLVPRNAEPRVVDEAPYFGNGAVISPDSRHALVSIWGTEREPVAWKVYDLETGEVETVNFPVPLKEVSPITLRDDGTVLWLSGSRPLDKGNYPTTHLTPLPESGEFPHPGKPFVVWAWKINSVDAPAKLYAAGTQWLEWRRPDKSQRLYVCRVSENPPARVECVTLDFAQSPPAQTTISQDEFEFHQPWMPRTRSFDGRFAFAAAERGFFAPAFIVDTKTGRKFRLPAPAMPFGPSYVHWSPSENKFLIEVTQSKLPAGLWRWRRDTEKTLEPATVVYFVDMDRQ